MNGQDQAAAWRIRRANRSKQFIAELTPWASGLVVATGDFVQSFGMAWQARNSGTTAGATAPNNSAGASFTDGGGVIWLHVPLLLTQPPTI